MRICRKIVQGIVYKEFRYKPKLKKSLKDIARIISRVEKLDNEEHMILVSIDYKNEKIAYTEVNLDNVESCKYADLKNIFKTVLLANVHKFILIQNRTNDVKITLEDIRTTKRIQDIANLLDIEFVDYIIINKDEYISCLYDDVKL